MVFSFQCVIPSQLEWEPSLNFLRRKYSALPALLTPRTANGWWGLCGSTQMPRATGIRTCLGERVHLSGPQSLSSPTALPKLAGLWDQRQSWVSHWAIYRGLFFFLKKPPQMCFPETEWGGVGEQGRGLAINRVLTILNFIPCLTSSLILPGVPTPRCITRFSRNFTCSRTFPR